MDKRLEKLDLCEKCKEKNKNVTGEILLIKPLVDRDYVYQLRAKRKTQSEIAKIMRISSAYVSAILKHRKPISPQKDYVIILCTECRIKNHLRGQLWR